MFKWPAAKVQTVLSVKINNVECSVENWDKNESPIPQQRTPQNIVNEHET